MLLDRKLLYIVLLVSMLLLTVSMVSASDVDSSTNISTVKSVDTAVSDSNVIEKQLLKTDKTVKTEEQTNIDYNVKNTTELTKTINTLNKVKTNQTSTINLKKGQYDNINITWKNRNVKLIINGNDSILYNATISTKANTRMTVNSLSFKVYDYQPEDLTYNQLTNITNNGTLELKKVNFTDTILNIENDNILKADRCNFINTSGFTLLRNNHVAEFTNTLFKENSLLTETDSLIKNYAKLAFVNTTVTENNMPIFISGIKYYSYFNQDSTKRDFYKISELLFVNSTLNGSTQYRYVYDYMSADKVTIVNSTLYDISKPVDGMSLPSIESDEEYEKEYEFARLTNLDTEQLTLINNKIFNCRINLISDNITSIGNKFNNTIMYDGNKEKNLVNTNKNKNSTIKSTNNYIKNFINTKPSIIYFDDVIFPVYDVEILPLNKFIVNNEYYIPEIYVEYSDVISFKIKLMDSKGNALKKRQIYASWDDELFSLDNATHVTDSKGISIFKFNVIKKGEITCNPIIFTTDTDSVFSKNKKIISTEKILRVTIDKKTTILSFDKIPTATYDKQFTITGRYKDNNDVNLRYTPLTLKLNGKSYTVKTDANGIFKYTFKASKMGANNVSVSYPGNSRYWGDYVEKIFYVGKGTKLTLNKIDNTVLLDKVTVTGKFTDANGNALHYTPININIAGKDFNATTDAYGVYTLSVKTFRGGKNTVVASYDGNSRYAGATATGTFNVLRKATKLSINDISNTAYSDNVTIKGKFTDVNGNALHYTPVKVSINNDTYKVTTDKNGFYTLKAKTSRMGTNTVVVSYSGNANYLGTSVNSTFKVTKKATKIFADKIGRTCTGDNATIKGIFKDTSGNVLRYTNLTVKVNSKTYNVKTDKNGHFTLKVIVSKIGKNNITISYAGNRRYKASSVKKIVNVVKMTTRITVNKIKKTKVKSKVNVTGKVSDKNGVVLRYAKLNVTVNDKLYRVKTNADGFYSLTVKTSVVGTNNITVYYAGTSKYALKSKSTSFEVTN